MTRGRIAIIIYLLALVGSIPIWGVPWSRDLVTLWLLGALVALAIGDWSRLGRRIIIDWAPIISILLIYDLIRGYADELGMPVQVTWMISADKLLWGGQVPTIWLQERFFHPQAPSLHDYLAWAIYTSHFFVTLVVLVVLWRFRHAWFRQLAPMVVVTTLLAFVGYVLHPAAPPWLAAQAGYLPDVTRHAWAMWNYVGVSPAATIFQGGTTYSNDVAAIPSLHAAYPALLLMFFWPRTGLTVRVGLASYAVLMGLTLMYTGEHYLVDVLLGWATAALGYGIVMIYQRWRANRTEAPAAPPVGTPADQDAVH